MIEQVPLARIGIAYEQKLGFCRQNRILQPILDSNGIIGLAQSPNNRCEGEVYLV
jgi:hypothetical protein